MAPLIVGAGPAGSAAAITLARAGVRPTIAEQSAATGDAICGGFLSWRTLDQLATLGIDPATLGGWSVRRLRLFAGDSMAETALPRPGVGVSRRRLDSLMLDRALGHGASLLRGKRLTRVSNEGAAAFGDEILRPQSLFVATGKHGVRGLARSARSLADPALGLRVRLEPDAGLARLVGDAIELHLFDRGYAGLVLHEDGSANLCLAVRKSRLADAGADPARLLDELQREPGLAERLSFRDPASPADAIAAIPYGFRATSTVPGRFLVGDQAACIPSLAGEGVGLAIASGIRAARAWLEGGADSAPAYQRRFARSVHRPMWLASLLWQVAERPALARQAVLLATRWPSLPHLAARLTRFED